MSRDLLNNRSEIVYDTISFSAFMDSWDQMSIFSTVNFVTENDPYPPALKAEHPQMIPGLEIAHLMARKLTIFYLVSITEAYAKDALTELIDRRVRGINFLLMGSPMPHNEDEDIAIEVNLAEAEDNNENSFHIFSKITRDYIKRETHNNNLQDSLRLLKNLFGVEIQDEVMHATKWAKLKKHRNDIVHHRAYSRDESLYPIAKNQSPTIRDMSFSPDTIKQVSIDAFEFAYAIESGICKSLSTSAHHRRSV